MTPEEFKVKLKWSFANHPQMCGRSNHTVNELLYVLGHDTQFADKEFNISVSKTNNSFCSIPGTDVFVDIHTRSVRFNDDSVEFEIEDLEYDGKTIKINCLSVYEIA